MSNARVTARIDGSALDTYGDTTALIYDNYTASIVLHPRLARPTCAPTAVTQCYRRLLQWRAGGRSE